VRGRVITVRKTLAHAPLSGDTSAIPQERSEIERMKAYILRRVGEPSDEEEESDGDDYDEDHVVKVKLGGDGEESDEESGEKPEARDIETILELAYITDPKQFDRDPQTRRSQARAKLRAQTGNSFCSCYTLIYQVFFPQAGWMNRLKDGGLCWSEM
jgi:hypothetical protein